MIQVTMASHKEGVASIAYVPVTNATIIAAMATKVNKRAKKNRKMNLLKSLRRGGDGSLVTVRDLKGVVVTDRDLTGVVVADCDLGT